MCKHLFWYELEHLLCSACVWVFCNSTKNFEIMCDMKYIGGGVDKMGHS